MENVSCENILIKNEMSKLNFFPSSITTSQNPVGSRSSMLTETSSLYTRMSNVSTASPAGTRFF